MIFTEALKKEVFGSTNKKSPLASARIVERSSIEAGSTRPSSVMKAAAEIAAIHKQHKPVS